MSGGVSCGVSAEGAPGRPLRVLGIETSCDETPAAVVEGTGDHGCEYMTGGKVAILGPIGRNFAAGMSGGYAFVLDLDEQRVNHELVELGPVKEDYAEELETMVRQHAEETGSRLAARILNDWEGQRGHFWHAVPKEYARYLPAPMEGMQATVAAE